MFVTHSITQQGTLNFWRQASNVNGTTTVGGSVAVGAIITLWCSVAVGAIITLWCSVAVGRGGHYHTVVQWHYMVQMRKTLANEQ